MLILDLNGDELRVIERVNERKFRKLRKAEVNLLYEIWQIEYLEQERAYPEHLASRLLVALGTVAANLSRLRDISKTEYVRSENDEHDRVYYVLAAHSLVTFTETAKVLQLLLEYPKKLQAQNRVGYEEFVVKASKLSGLTEADIRNVICSAEKLSYLRVFELNGHWIFREPRLGYEAEYIKRVSAHYVPAKRTRKAGGRAK